MYVEYMVVYTIVVCIYGSLSELIVVPAIVVAAYVSTRTHTHKHTLIWSPTKQDKKLTEKICLLTFLQSSYAGS